MTVIAHGATDRYGEDAYLLLTNVHRPVFTDLAPVPFESPCIEEFVWRELDTDEGTPEWRAWLAGWVRRHPAAVAVP